jgi:hypothetical protein
VIKNKSAYLCSFSQHTGYTENIILPVNTSMFIGLFPASAMKEFISEINKYINKQMNE